MQVIITLTEYIKNIGVSKSVLNRWLKEYKKYQKTINELQVIKKGIMK